MDGETHKARENRAVRRQDSLNGGNGEKHPTISQITSDIRSSTTKAKHL